MTMSQNIQLDVKEIYAQLCPKCKARIRELVKAKISDQMVAQILGAEEAEKPHEG
jgi:hypothetical protein